MLRSQLSSWAVRQSGGITAGGWRGLYTSRGSGHQALGMRGMGWLRGGAAQPQCSKSPSTGALSIRWPWNSRRESTLLRLRVLLSKRDASLPSQSRARRWLCQHSKAPLAGQLLAEQGVLSGSQIRRQQLSVPFYECQADGEQEHLLLFPGSCCCLQHCGGRLSLPSLGRGILASVFPRGC